MPSKLTIARTIRLDPDVDVIIRQEAEQTGLTHTSVTTKALRKYAHFDRFADKIGSLTVSKETLSRLLSFLSDEEAEIVGSVANFAGKNSRQYMSLIVGGTTIQDFLSLLQIFSTYAHLFEFEHKVEGTKHHLIFAHNMGSKWSSFLQGAMQATLKEVFGFRARFEKTESFLTMIFETKG
ncbi:MAG: hypothetical protein ACREBS_05050 [Nitrososphaerales archaeon]